MTQILAYISILLHFEDKSKRPDQKRIKLHKLRVIYEALNQAYLELCNPLDSLSVENVIYNSNTELFRGSTFPRKDLVSKYTNCVTIESRLVTCEGTWVRTNGLPLET